MVGRLAAEHHGLVFATEALLAFDIGDHSKFYAPNRRFYLLRDEQAFVGVGALQRIDAITAEIQRMVAQAPWRGRGAASRCLSRFPHAQRYLTRPVAYACCA